MAGWMHLPRYIDKIRLHSAGQLAPDYQNNFGKGFDGWWLEAAGLNHEEFVALVRGTVCDGQVCDWVVKHVRRSEGDKQAHAARMLNYPPAGDAALQDRLNQRKQASGFGQRDELKTFVDYIDADEGRL
jgi:gluconokinase